MKKAICIIALAAISFGSAFAAAPVKVTNHAMQMDTTKMKKKKMKMKKGDTSPMKMKKDTSKM
ncbi:hypothetical protein [Mucilaginibacter sp.]